MVTIPEVVEKIIKNTPFLEEALSQQIINLSALARKIKPEIEKQLYKNIKTGAIIMALKRLSKKKNLKNIGGTIFKKTPEMIVRSNLVEFTFFNSDSLLTNYKELLVDLKNIKNYFFTITHGIFETTIIVSGEIEKIVEQTFKNEKIISQFDNLSSITIRLPKENVETPGVYYQILKILAWEGINVIEVVSTSLEFTIVLEDEEIDHAFSILKETLT